MYLVKMHVIMNTFRLLYDYLSLVSFLIEVFFFILDIFETNLKQRKFWIFYRACMFFLHYYIIRSISTASSVYLPT